MRGITDYLRLCYNTLNDTVSPLQPQDLFTYSQKAMELMAGFEFRLGEICDRINEDKTRIPQPLMEFISELVSIDGDSINEERIVYHVDMGYIYDTIATLLETVNSSLPGYDWRPLHCRWFIKESANVPQTETAKQNDMVEVFKTRLINSPEYKQAVGDGLIINKFEWVGKKIDLMRFLDRMTLEPGGCYHNWQQVDGVFTWNGKRLSRQDLANFWSSKNTF